MVVILEKISHKIKNQMRVLVNHNPVFYNVMHHFFATLGALLCLLGLVLGCNGEWQRKAEQSALDFLQVRQNNSRVDLMPSMVLSPISWGRSVLGMVGIHKDTNTNTNANANANNGMGYFLLSGSNKKYPPLPSLSAQQNAVTQWLSKKYAVAPEALGTLVEEAYVLGAKAKLEPTLILAIMAMESGFNPFAQSPVGAQGLMQVMTHIHSDKYAKVGGKMAAFDPIVNLRVGVKVLQESIARGGSLVAGLKHYVGAANLANDGGYGSKVGAEYARLYQVATGRLAPALFEDEKNTVTQSVSTENFVSNLMAPMTPSLFTTPAVAVPASLSSAVFPLVDLSATTALPANSTTGVATGTAFNSNDTLAVSVVAQTENMTITSP